MLLQEAAKSGNHHPIPYLLEFNNKPAADNSLYLACENGHLEVAKILLAAEAKPDRARGYDGKTALHVASEKQTALHAASNNGHLKVVKALVAAGADTSVSVSFRECVCVPGCFSSCCPRLLFPLC
jgi:ankyrin repeat protein